MTGAIDAISPLKIVRLHTTDKPWMTTSLKQLIKDRQSAFHRGETTQWQRLKSKLQSEIEYRKKEFYKNKIKHLRKDDCRKWWDAVNKLSRKPRKNTNIMLERNGNKLSDLELVNSLKASPPPIIFTEV